MNLQYVTDNLGETTGVLIPIKDWNLLKNKYKELENDFIEIPTWHKQIVNKRMEEYKKKPEIILDFNNVIEQIENEL